MNIYTENTESDSGHNLLRCLQELPPFLYRKDKTIKDKSLKLILYVSFL